MLRKARRLLNRRRLRIPVRLCQCSDLQLKDIQTLAHFLATFNEPAISESREVFNPLDDGRMDTPSLIHVRTKVGNKMRVIIKSAIDGSDLMLQ